MPRLTNAALYHVGIDPTIQIFKKDKDNKLEKVAHSVGWTIPLTSQNPFLPLSILGSGKNK
jgi:hypothetical protein